MVSYPQFVLFGDSLLEFSSHLIDGFSLSAALQSHYIRRLDVINRGLAGYNTAQALEIIPRIIPPPSCSRMDYLLVLFGANDACLPGTPTNQHVPCETYKTNLKALITHTAVVAHHPKIILATPPPIDEDKQEVIDASKGNPLCRRAAVTAKYAEAAREVAREVGGDLLILDLWSAVMEEAIRNTPDHNHSGPILGSKDLGESKALSHLMPDGLHFGGAGYRLFFQLLLSAMESKWPSPTTATDAYILPVWLKAPRMEVDPS